MNPATIAENILSCVCRINTFGRKFRVFDGVLILLLKEKRWEHVYKEGRKLHEEHSD